MRLETSAGQDSNVLEALAAPNRKSDAFLRLLGEGRADRRGLPLDSAVNLALRLLSERYDEQVHEGRVQGEALVSVDLRGPARAARSQLSAGVKRCAFPDSSGRNFQRNWGRAATGFRLGPGGMLLPRLDFWTLDFRSTSRRDQAGLSVDLSYEHPLRRWLVLEGGLELAGIHHGYPSNIWCKGEDCPASATLVYGSDRHDALRFAHVSLRMLRFGLFRLEYGYRSQHSNSVDAVLGRHEVRWLISRGLPLGCMGQFYGNLERTRYLDRGLKDWDVQKLGEIEANADDNTIALRLSRALGKGWTTELRHSWYRNESLFIRNYYQKRIWTVGLGWGAGSLSGF